MREMRAGLLADLWYRNLCFYLALNFQGVEGEIFAYPPPGAPASGAQLYLWYSWGMSAPYQGGCACGAVRFELAAEPMAFALCYCRDCQYAAGGPPSHGLFVNRTDVSVTAGNDRIKPYEKAADSGNMTFRSFCADCGTHLFAGNEGRPATMLVKIGAMDDQTAWPKPQLAVWTCSTQPWHDVDPDIPQYEKAFTE